RSCWQFAEASAAQMRQHEVAYDSVIEFSDREALAADPVVSVYMGVFNHAPFLEQAVRSVVAQNAPFPYEIVIGEDCSTDASRSIAISMQQAFPSLVRVVTGHANVGAQSNFARAMERVR